MEVRVAVLSTMDTVNPKVPSTVESAALCKMVDRHQISGALVDAPLVLDNAIDLEAARIKRIDSPVAGRASVLLVPDLEAGNMLDSWLAPMRPGSCSVRGCQSFSPAGPIPCPPGWRPSPLPPWWRKPGASPQR